MSHERKTLHWQVHTLIQERPDGKLQCCAENKNQVSTHPSLPGSFPALICTISNAFVCLSSMNGWNVFPVKWIANRYYRNKKECPKQVKNQRNTALTKKKVQEDQREVGPLLLNNSDTCTCCVTHDVNNVGRSVHVQAYIMACSSVYWLEPSVAAWMEVLYCGKKKSSFDKTHMPVVK